MELLSAAAQKRVVRRVLHQGVFETYIRHPAETRGGRSTQIALIGQAHRRILAAASGDSADQIHVRTSAQELLQLCHLASRRETIKPCQKRGVQSVGIVSEGVAPIMCKVSYFHHHPALNNGLG